MQLEIEKYTEAHIAHDAHNVGARSGEEFEADFHHAEVVVQFAGQANPTRLNVHRYWRVEFDQLFAALPQQTQQAVVDPGDQPQAS